MMQFTKSVARREQVKLMIGLTGPSGAGKTFSALQMAYGITGDWKKIAVADTENKSSLYYAGEQTGDWQHIPFPPTMPQGYHPHNWCQLIRFAERDPSIEVLILDSISHEWEGAGGCLDLVDRIAKGFAGWKAVTPLHNDFIDTMRHSRLHIIATMRSKTDYVVEQNDRGKQAPRKVGLKSSQREGTDYEFGIIFDIEISHLATASKDRTGLYAARGPFMITPETGRELLRWANSGEAPALAQPPAPGTIPVAAKGDSVYLGEDESERRWLMEKLKAAKVAEALWKTVHERMRNRPRSDVGVVFRDTLAESRRASVPAEALQ